MLIAKSKFQAVLLVKCTERHEEVIFKQKATVDMCHFLLTLCHFLLTVLVQISAQHWDKPSESVCTMINQVKVFLTDRWEK